MKIRTGFVSNSSSSSFLLIDRNSTESLENFKNNKKVLKKYGGEEYLEESVPEELQRLKILGAFSVDYGGEESVKNVISLINTATFNNFELIDLENY